MKTKHFYGLDLMHNGFIVTKDGEKYSIISKFEDAETFAVNLANSNPKSTIQVFFNTTNENWRNCIAANYSFQSPDYLYYHRE